jgi:hypothetical protein
MGIVGLHYSHYLLFAVECGVIVLIAYTYHLKYRVFERQQQRQSQPLVDRK